jgi:hypothetical protein
MSYTASHTSLLDCTKINTYFNIEFHAENLTVTGGFSFSHYRRHFVLHSLVAFGC